MRGVFDTLKFGERLDKSTFPENCQRLTECSHTHHKRKMNWGHRTKMTFWGVLRTR